MNSVISVGKFLINTNKVYLVKKMTFDGEMHKKDRDNAAKKHVKYLYGLTPSFFAITIHFSPQEMLSLYEIEAWEFVRQFTDIPKDKLFD